MTDPEVLALELDKRLAGLAVKASAQAKAGPPAWSEVASVLQGARAFVANLRAGGDLAVYDGDEFMDDADRDDLD